MNKYISTIDRKHDIHLAKFRTGNHRFPIEVGRYHDIPRDERHCEFCQNSHRIGDEMHFLLEYPTVKALRKKFISKNYYKRPNIIKFRQVLLLHDRLKLEKTAYFISILLEKIDK